MIDRVRAFILISIARDARAGRGRENNLFPVANTFGDAEKKRKISLYISLNYIKSITSRRPRNWFCRCTKASSGLHRKCAAVDCTSLDSGRLTVTDGGRGGRGRRGARSRRCDRSDPLLNIY
ncbi:hypothetical protein EVAR_23067_1 [Eumeta japonica]|uniref:Uncharacterized protein n=1 Tax=Eumeta variegata TaxID=151549 RepID=A0A4C1VMW6_EUMVA|nr:hypothetical protein EVAR_23067_1 [Eumeta japonica]